jgi:hypothetical protein
VTQAGWFPDPGGQRGMYRYWDGSSWTQQLSPDPGKQPGKDGNNLPLIIGAVVIVVVLAVVAFLTLPRLFGDPDDPTRPTGPEPTPTVSAWDETTKPSPTPTRPTPTRPSPPETSLPCPKYTEAVVDGRLYGGGLSVAVIDNPRWGINPVRTIPWAIRATGLEKQITDDWVSEVVLAGVQPRSLTENLESQAKAIAEDARLRFYRGDDARLSIKASASSTTGGLPSWTMRFEVRVDNRGPNIPGDVVDLIVVQHSGGRSALMTFATIGDTETQAQVDGSRNSVRVERK